MSRHMPAAMPRNSQDSQIIDQACQSNRLDELENALNVLVAPQRIVNASAGDRADSILAYQGQADLGVFQLRIGRDVEINLEPEEADDRIAFVRTASGAGELLIEGKTVPCSRERAAIITSGAQRITRIAEDMESKVFMADRVKMAECCAKLLGHDIPGFVNFDISADLETASGRSWLRLLSYAEAELADPHAFIRQSPVAWRQFEQQLLTGFLLSHQHGYSQALLAPQAAAVPFYVKRAEAYIEAHFAEPLSLADLAAQAGVSARSLQNGFQNFRNITPMGFLRSVRLRRAHEALLSADPAVVTVTQIASACGFTHLGEFGTAYRRVFGVTPGQTLQKKLRL
ncbi:AraC family transcriptional regulator [Microvirga sp. KLBC 81]|uniref:AraC family transcriptional regulator n=1 Tax=Microvirga sp. KLBC 81 TaxID=1862707 RepID=UPI000D5163B8|nr:AraC family transcriptional regulator [Microvirga sp. KLBC 81]PVE24106.1 AraC family transcriptional regulator [Microvirga sp. KLBC 81]